MERITFPTFSALLDRFYEEREHLERIKQRGQDLIRSVTTAGTVQPASLPTRSRSWPPHRTGSACASWETS